MGTNWEAHFEKGANGSWLWDRKISEEEARGVLSNADHPKFDIYAELLFGRVSDPKTAFSYVDKITFCRKWPAIKKRLRKDKWFKQQVSFWQTIYERTKEQLSQEGIKVRKIKKKIPSERIMIAEQIVTARKERGYRQKDLAAKLNVIQQYISRIESGKENFSIDILINIAKALNKKLTIKMEETE